jgi:hypothetical protein
MLTSDAEREPAGAAPPVLPRLRRTKTPEVRLTKEVAATFGVPTAVHRRRTWLKTKLM